MVHRNEARMKSMAGFRDENKEFVDNLHKKIIEATWEGKFTVTVTADTKFDVDSARKFMAHYGYDSNYTIASGDNLYFTVEWD